MRRLAISSIIATSGLALVGTAYAADLPFLSKEPLVVSEFVSNWYLRGDVGYRVADTSGGGLAGVGFTDTSGSNVASFDFGIGYKMGAFRADVTANYGMKQHFFGSSAVAAPDVQATFEAITTLVSGYYDFGTWYGLTPYVGAGIGFTWIKPSNVSSISLFTLAPAVTTTSPGGWDFSWAATAGVSYPITRNLALDTSYRFLHVGTPKTTLSNIGIIDYGDINAHEFRFGARYMID